MVSVEILINEVNWSYSFMVERLIRELCKDYSFHIAVRDSTSVGAKPTQDSDIVLVQNVDSIKIYTDKSKVIGRIGGMRTFKGDTHRFDKDLSEVFAIIACNQELYDIARRVNSNVYLIPNAVDLDKFRPMRIEKKREFTVGFVGNISFTGAAEYKGYELVVEACKQAKVRLKEALFGDDLIPNHLMPARFYRYVDCLVLPSKNEGCSNTITEALACGVPVIITKVGYHGDMLKDKVNCLFVERNVESIKKAIIFLRENPAKRKKIGKAGRLFAEKYHDIKKVAKEYDKIFKQLLGSKKQMQQEEKEMWVVEALHNIFDGEIGKIDRGMKFVLSLRRAKQLKGLVKLIRKEGEDAG